MSALSGARGLACRITAAFCAGDLDLKLRPDAPSPGWNGMPEVAMANLLRREGATDTEVRLYITFTAALDRARDADLLWQRSARMFRETKWPFSPTDAASRPLPELQDVLRAYGVSQRHTPDSLGWKTIAETISKPPLNANVHSAIYEGRGDAKMLLTALRAHRSGRALFPFLRGPKVGPMWVRMLAYPGGASITSLETLPVAVDVQVRKVTEYLGVTETHGQDLQLARSLIQAKWAEDVRLHGADGPASLSGTPAALDPALWFYAKWGCTRCERAGRRLPIADICQECRFDQLTKGRQNNHGTI